MEPRPLQRPALELGQSLGSLAPALFGNLALARRLESAEAQNAAGLTEAWAGQIERLLSPHPNVAALAIAGGQAAFAGIGSPLSHAIGLGLAGPVSSAELDRLEAFYQSRGAAITLDVCPLADPSLHELLGQRGYRIVEFNNVLVRPLAPGESSPDTPGVRRAPPEQQDEWARTVSRGFFEREEITADELALTGLLFHLPSGTSWLADIDGVPVAAAGMATPDRVATLFGDSTIAAFRGKGLHSALIRARLAYAVEQGCNVATASTLPGSGSQRNYERLGFRVIYTKHIMCRDWPRS